MLGMVVFAFSRFYDYYNMWLSWYPPVGNICLGGKLLGQKGFRKGVVGVFVDEAGQILVCERQNRPGSWQFPQGGIDEGEDPLAALRREVEEEIGCRDFEVLKTGNEWTRYEFPDEVCVPIAKKYKGQEHLWFLLRFTNGGQPDLAQSDGEFRDWKWVPVENALDTVIEWKLGAYKHGLEILGVLT